MVTRQQSKSSAKPSKGSRAAAPRRPGWREAIDGHEGDLAGLACLLVAFVAGLGIYADWSGVVGQALREGIGLLVGWVRLAVPIALVVVGIALIRGQRTGRATAALDLAFALLTVSATGLLQLALGPSDWGAPLDEFRDAGGYLGAVDRPPSAERARDRRRHARPRRRRCRRPPDPHRATLRAIAARAADGVRPVHAAARRVVGSMSTLSGERFGTKPAGDEVIDVREIVPSTSR